MGNAKTSWVFWPEDLGNNLPFWTSVSSSEKESLTLFLLEANEMRNLKATHRMCAERSSSHMEYWTRRKGQQGWGRPWCRDGGDGALGTQAMTTVHTVLGPRLVRLSGLSAGLQTERLLFQFSIRTPAWAVGQVLVGDM